MLAPLEISIMIKKRAKKIIEKLKQELYTLTLNNLKITELNTQINETIERFLRTKEQGREL